MNESRLTPWFDGSKFKPARPGVYMLMSGANVGYQKWDGKAWSLWSSDPHTAANKQKGEYALQMHQNDNWRGLLTKPKRNASKGR